MKDTKNKKKNQGWFTNLLIFAGKKNWGGKMFILSLFFLACVAIAGTMWVIANSLELTLSGAVAYLLNKTGLFKS